MGSGEEFPTEWVASRNLESFWQQRGREAMATRTMRKAGPHSSREVLAGVRRANPSGSAEEVAERHEQRAKKQQGERKARRAVRAG